MLPVASLPLAGIAEHFPFFGESGTQSSVSMLSHVCTYELSASFPNPTFLTVSLFVNDVSAECLLHICPAHSSRDLRSAAVTSLLLFIL